MKRDLTEEEREWVTRELMMSDERGRFELREYDN